MLEMGRHGLRFNLKSKLSQGSKLAIYLNHSATDVHTHTDSVATAPSTTKDKAHLSCISIRKQ